MSPDRNRHLPRPLICTPLTSVPAELLRSSIQCCPPSSQIRACRRDTAVSGVRSRSTGAEGTLRPMTSASPKSFFSSRPWRVMMICMLSSLLTSGKALRPSVVTYPPNLGPPISPEGAGRFALGFLDAKGLGRRFVISQPDENVLQVFPLLFGQFEQQFNLHQNGLLVHCDRQGRDDPETDLVFVIHQQL